VNQKTQKNVGSVKLVGAGPGDRGLITVAGLNWLRKADVVVHDALVSKGLLDQAGGESDAGESQHDKHVELIDVGKRHSDHKLSQDDINKLLATKALQGQLVVRLKGGDPFVFGRGAEEAAHLKEQGIDVQVIPGVTAGIAALATAGIPVTHRTHSSAVLFVTGHEDETKTHQSQAHESWANVVTAGGTLCIYMGMTKLEPIINALRNQNLPDDTPAAIVQWGTTARQRSLRTTLGDLVNQANATGIWAPAIVTIGQVAAINTLPVNDIKHRPLLGKRVVITRSRSQTSILRDKLEACGAEVLEAPTIRITPPSKASWKEIDHAIKTIEEYDWLVLTSANGVKMLADRMEHLRLDARHFATVKFAAVGSATAAALLSRMSIRANLVPPSYVAENLAAQLIQQTSDESANRRFLLLRGDLSRKALADLLTAAGHCVDDLPIYQNQPEPALPKHALRQLRLGRVDWITFTSSSTVRNFVHLLGDQLELLTHVRIASIGPITTQTLREYDLTPAIEANPSDIEHLIEAMCQI
jgi:uroporphyrinogen III methyltransferase / synthase